MLWLHCCVTKAGLKEWYFVRFIFSFWSEENCFPCEWLVFWVTNGEVSVENGKVLSHERSEWFKVFPFQTLTSPFVTQKTSHSQGKQVFVHSKKRKWNEQITFLDFPTTANNTFYANLAEFQSKYGDNLFISDLIHQKLQLTEEKYIWEQGHGIIRNLCYVTFRSWGVCEG